MRKLLNWLLQPHPEETARGIWFQEEARAERLTSLMRMVYVAAWLPLVIAIAKDHPPTANLSNILGGLVYLVFATAYYAFLRHKPYQKWHKYFSTTFDVLWCTATLWVYQYEMGYSTSLKAPPFMNYLMILFIALMRYSRVLPLYTAGLSIVLYSGMFVWLLNTQDVQFGTPLELFTTEKINLVYQFLRLMWLVIAGVIGSWLASSIRRLVRLREEEIERTLVERAERQKTQDLFERYFSTDIASYLTDHPQDMGGQTRQVTLLITDLRGFTTLSEKIGPEETVSMLNTVFDKLVDIVFKYNGTLDKFTGDGMLVAFGTLDPRPDDARRAVQAAREMVTAVKDLGGVHPLRLGVGIHSGEVIFGNVGSPKRMELTVIGDAVNTVSRIEELNKEFGTQIILSEATFTQMNADLPVRSLPPRALRGKSEPVQLYALDG